MTPAHPAAQLALLGAVTAAGAAAGLWLGLPVPLLTGPMIATTLVCLFWRPVLMPGWLRDAVFLLAGVTIGSGVSRESLAALATWPLAFAVLCLSVLAMMVVGPPPIARILGTARAPALLACAPGHLSFVIALGDDAGVDTRQVAIVQTIRILALMLLVPFFARWAGFDTSGGFGGGGVPMTVVQTAACLIAALALAPVLHRIGAPGPVILAGMLAGAVARVSEWVPGGMSPLMASPALALIGALVGSRFAGISLAEVRRAGIAGLAVTAIAMGCAMIGALIAAPIVGMPLLHVLVAFAPGGLEAMVVLGAAVGANPGFVAAGHVLRLLFISVAVPWLLARARAKDARKAAAPPHR